MLDVNGVFASFRVLAGEAVSAELPDAIFSGVGDALEGGENRTPLSAVRVFPMGIWLAELGAIASHAGRREAVDGVVNNVLAHIVADLGLAIVEGVFRVDLLIVGRRFAAVASLARVKGAAAAVAFIISHCLSPFSASGVPLPLPRPGDGTRSRPE